MYSQGILTSAAPRLPLEFLLQETHSTYLSFSNFVHNNAGRYTYDCAKRNIILEPLRNSTESSTSYVPYTFISYRFTYQPTRRPVHQVQSWLRNCVTCDSRSWLSRPIPSAFLFTIHSSTSYFHSCDVRDQYLRHVDRFSAGSKYHLRRWTLILSFIDMCVKRRNRYRVISAHAFCVVQVSVSSVSAFGKARGTKGGDRPAIINRIKIHYNRPDYFRHCLIMPFIHVTRSVCEYFAGRHRLKPISL